MGFEILERIPGIPLTSSCPGVILRTGVMKSSEKNSFWEHCRQKAASHLRRVLLVESEDPRVLSAAQIVHRRSIAHPLLVGNVDRVSAEASRIGLDLKGIECVDPATDPRTERLGRDLFEKRKGKGLTEEQAHILVQDPLFFGVMALHGNFADGLVAGAVRTTSETVRAGFWGLGLAPHVEIAFGAMVMDCPFSGGHSRTLLFADCAVSPHPSPRALAAVGIAAAELFEKLVGGPARVAFLSFSTLGSAADDSVVATRHAVELVRKKAPTLLVDGELQADAALVDVIARQKGMGHSLVAGQANVLVFPDLNAGNTGYKLVQHLGGARAVGPLLVGLAKPMSDLSRGCTDEDIVDAVALTALL